MEITVGVILEGTIKSITKFGAFVNLPGGRSGLVHISEISHTYVTEVRDFLTEGQKVKVKVVGIDDAGRINLSMRKAAPPSERPQNGNREHQSNRQESRTGGRSSSRSANNYAKEKNQAPGPADFEARLKQFMQSSDSKLSDLKMTEKRSSRRSGHR